MDLSKPSHDHFQPPVKSDKEYLKEEIKSVRNGLGGFLIAGFALGRTSQIFSRVPGSSGALLMIGWLAGVFIQGFYFYGYTENYGWTDATPFEALIAVQAVVWIAGCVLLLLRKRPTRGSDLGIGMLVRFCPTLGKQNCGVLSDLCVGLLLAGILFAINSPVQAQWYLVITAWISFCHLCAFLRQWSYQLGMRAAARRARSWQKDVRGRHYL